MQTQTPELIITPSRTAVAAGEPVDLEVLVRFQAPDASPDGPATRQPLNLALVIDRSGSMHGRPLDEAKRCAIELVDRLSSSDRLSVVAYDDQVSIIEPARPVADRERLRASIASIRPGGSTALHAGWVAGAHQLLPSVRPGALSRVLLLSDGQANQGLTEAGAIAAQAAELSALGVSTSTYGLGHSFNEELMTAMARAGEGQAWYGETAEDLREPFHAELNLLHALFATGVTLRVDAADGVAVTVLNPYRSPTPMHWRLPAVAYGAESWALLALRAPAPRGAAVRLLRVSVDYADAAGQSHQLSVPPLQMPVVDAAAWRRLESDPLVARRAAEMRAAALQDAARAAALDGDWTRVDHLLAEARQLAAASPWVGELVRILEDLAAQREAGQFSKQARYAAHSMGQRLVSKRELAGLAEEADAPDWLRRKVEQGKALFGSRPPNRDRR